MTDGSALIYQALHLAKSLPFTDKSLKMGLLSVKCVLLTDKSAKNGTLSVNLSEIFDKSVEQHCILKKVVFIHWKLKKPDKGSRNLTAFVRPFV